MRRLSLTAALAGAFTLITLLTFYFVGSYLYNNLYLQLLNGGTAEIVLKAQHLRSLAAAEESAQALRGHASRFAGQVSGNDAYVVQIRSIDHQTLMDFNPSDLPVLAAPVLPDTSLAHDADVRQWPSAAGGMMRGLAVQARLRNGDLVTIVVGRSFDDILHLLQGKHRSDI